MNYEKIIKKLESKRKYWEKKYKKLEEEHKHYCEVASGEIARLRDKLGYDKK